MGEQKGQMFWNEGDQIKNPKRESRGVFISIWRHPDRKDQWLANVVVPTSGPDHLLVLEDAADIADCLRYYAELSMSDKVGFFLVHWEDCPVLDLLKKARTSFKGLSAAIKILLKRHVSHDQR